MVILSVVLCSFSRLKKGFHLTRFLLGKNILELCMKHIHTYNYGEIRNKFLDFYFSIYL
jgi:hypothetical protein